MNFLDILRGLPVDATLEALMTKHGLPIPAGFPWTDTPQSTQTLIEAVVQWPDEKKRNVLIGDLVASARMADTQAQQFLLQSVTHDAKLLGELVACKSDLHRAFWLFVHHPKLFDQAQNSDFLERRSSKAVQHDLDVKKRPIETDAAKAAFEKAMSKFYKDELQCGDSIESRLFERSHGVFLMSVHVKALPTVQIEFQGDSLARHVGHPSIDMVLEYSMKSGVARSVARGGARFHERFAEYFAEHILGEKVDAKRVKPAPLELGMLRNGFDVPQAIQDGFIATQLKSITLFDENEELKVECTATAKAEHKHVSDLMKARLVSEPLEGNWKIAAATIHLYYPAESGKRPKVVPIEVTSKGRLNLHKLDPVMQAQVEGYLVEIGILAKGQQLEAQEVPYIAPVVED